jgi:hypothetical protein
VRTCVDFYLRPSTSGFVRFCSEQFNLDAEKLDDPYTHLTNNQINKRNAKGPRGGVRVINWTLAQLKQYLQAGGGSRGGSESDGGGESGGAAVCGADVDGAGTTDSIFNTGESNHKRGTNTDSNADGCSGNSCSGSCSDPWDRVWEKIHSLVRDTFKHTVGTLEVPISGRDTDLGGRKCFELFGLDVLIDSK